jgi:hypothetical protein
MSDMPARAAERWQRRRPSVSELPLGPTADSDVLLLQHLADDGVVVPAEASTWLGEFRPGGGR